MSSIDPRRDPGAVRPLRDELPLPQAADDLEDEERDCRRTSCAICQPSSAASRSDWKASSRRPARSFGPSRASAIACACVAAASTLGDPRLRHARAASCPTSRIAVPGHGQRQRREERAPLLRREVQVVDQDDRRALARPARASRARTPSGASPSSAAPRPVGVGSPRRRAAKAGTRSGVGRR